ncbi:ABC transporter substrate-binding protein [Bacillus sp. ISL-55]|uniref:ABC transporter substrate-binding protein n=1 Tax=Bacillus sp. ISL-55 TaxID=2819134 RepID=UPI001BE50E89|nr:ABC transporter substrate-binding protein [Bacillus sp. ISL-55]MBT2692074.1 ABC transporter substrate-binding protein [Bacillus sp. ISL-55]
MKNSQPFVLFILLLCSVLLIAGCNKYNEEATTKSNDQKDKSPADTASEVFNFATNQDIPHLDPHGTGANTSFRITYMLYDRLVNYDGTTTEITPMLAEKWDIANNGLSYTFHLRKDAKFHDGSTVTAEAVKYSYLRALKVGKSAAGQFKKVIDEDSFEIVDDHTITINLKHPYAPFLKTLGTVYANIVNPKLAEHEGEDLGEEYLADKEMGSGPYKLESWERGQKLVLTAKEDYWGEKPTLKKVNILVIPEASTARIMLEKGEVDMLDTTTISPSTLEEMDGKNGIKVHSSPSYKLVFGDMNMSKAPFDNPLIRKAFVHAVNYEAIIENIYLGNAFRVNSAVPKGMFGFAKDTPLYLYDLEKAKQFIEEAGYKDRLEFEISISENDEVYKNMAVTIQSDLAKIGAKVTIKEYAWPTYLDLITSGNHNISLGAWTPDFADPDYNLWYFAHSSSKGPGFNTAFYDNKQVDQLLEEARTSVDEAKREELYEDVQKIMAEEIPYAFIAQTMESAPVKDYVKGYEMNPMNTWYVPFHKISK